jgi:hypothetical protein
MSRYRLAAIVAALALLFGLAGRMDYEDQQAEQANYCEMVKAGFWPDYQGTYRHECRTPKSGQR